MIGSDASRIVQTTHLKAASFLAYLHLCDRVELGRVRRLLQAEASTASGNHWQNRAAFERLVQIVDMYLETSP